MSSCLHNFRRHKSKALVVSITNPTAAARAGFRAPVAGRRPFSVTDPNPPVAGEITPGVIHGAPLRIAAPGVDRGIIFVARVVASFVVAIGIGGIIAAMAHGTSDDRACREPAKRPGYDRASIPRRCRCRRCRQGRPKRQGSDNYQKSLLIPGHITFSLMLRRISP